MNLIKKYPRTLIAVFSFIFALFLLTNVNIIPFHNLILSSSYFGSFIAGFLYVFTFTAAPATVLLILLHSTQNLLLLGIIAGVGALLGDLVIYKTARAGFHNEAERFLRESKIRHVRRLIPTRIRRSVAIIIAFVVIGSPLPDEFGVAMISNFGLINSKYFIFVSFLLNTIGIFTILLIKKALTS